MGDDDVIEARLVRLEIEALRLIAKKEAELREIVRKYVSDRAMADEILKYFLRNHQTRNIYENLQYIRQLQYTLSNIRDVILLSPLLKSVQEELSGKQS